VLVSDADPEARYRLLQTLRACAQERLTESGEEAKTREKHAQYYSGPRNLHSREGVR